MFKTMLSSVRSLKKDYTNELVFGVNNNVVGFYSMETGKKIGANKAYLEATARAMKLVFDGDVTGIENVMGEAADANAPYLRPDRSPRDEGCEGWLVHPEW